MHGVRRYTKTIRLMLFCASILAGLVLARKAPTLTGGYVAALAFLSLLTFRRGRLLSVYIIVLFGLSLGWWQGSQTMRELRMAQSLQKQRITITAKAISDAVYDDKRQLSFDASEASYQGKRIIGKIGISGYGESMIYRGDEVTIEGKFNLGRGSYIGYISFAEISVVSRSQSRIYALNRSFAAGMQNALPEPYASFGLGLLIGQRDTLPKYVSDTLGIVGLTHIIAVSGYNVTIIIQAMRRLLGKRSRFQTWLGCQALISLFLLTTGFSASIVRAALISSLSLGAWYYGRTIKPLLLLLLAAAITALWNPLYLWSDIGWYLSFLAFYGVLILAPLLQKRFNIINKQKILGSIVLETICAQLMTLPIILYIFHDSHFLALPANVLVVPFIPLAMLLSCVSAIAGMAVPSLAGWIAWPAKIILTYILDMAAFFARVPHMKFSMSFGVSALIMLYLIIVMISFILWHKSKQTDTITEVN